MSYLVLARKYRPRTFEQMVGQEHVVQALANALTQQRLHHAYLFTGTRGVGKTTVSRILAKSLNCVGPDGQGGITATPCGRCEACREIDAGRFVDYVELDAASNRGVEEISQLLDQAIYKPVVGRFKVYMIDEVHMLSNTAFNAMLKTLEEPPEYLKFVLATTDPQKVPVTVLSRCLQFNLRPMAPETVCEHLTRVLQAEAIEADPAAVRLLARAARGSMRDALSLTDQAIAFGSGRLEEASVRQMLGAVDRSHVYRLLEALAARDGRTVVATAEELRARGLSAAGALEEMATVLQEIAVAQVVPESVSPDDPEASTVTRLAAALPAEETQLLYSMALHGRNELGLAPDEYSGLTMALLRMLAFRPADSGPVRAQALQRPPAATARVPVAPPRAAAAHAERRGAGEPAVPARAAPTPVLEPSSSPLGVGTSPGAAATRPVAPALQSGPRRSAGDVCAPPPRAPGAAVPSARERAPATARIEDDLPPWLDAPVADEHEAAQPLPQVAPQSHSSAVARDIAVAPVADAAPLQEAEPRSATVSHVWKGPTATGAVAPLVHGDRWHACVRQLCERELVAALVRELAMQSELVEVDDAQTHFHLRVERGTLAAEGTRAKLEAALTQLLGHAVRLQVEVAPTTDTPARREAAEREARQRAAEEALRNDPLVVSLLQQFATARIVPGSVKPL
ncbi:DNA polymerase III subunit gamma/tau [Schlegelella aquatica]|uniref:DNA polymerase III subunit gamma/tau n=1 Tax=Caldimonas aquatica TaxID=376175 RepID=UPI003752B86E